MIFEKIRIILYNYVHFFQCTTIESVFANGRHTARDGYLGQSLTVTEGPFLYDLHWATINVGWDDNLRTNLVGIFLHRIIEAVIISLFQRVFKTLLINFLSGINRITFFNNKGKIPSFRTIIGIE